MRVSLRLYCADGLPVTEVVTVDYPALLRKHKIKFTGLEPPNPILALAQLANCPPCVVANWEKMGLSQPTAVQMASWGIILEVSISRRSQTALTSVETRRAGLCADGIRQNVGVHPSAAGRPGAGARGLDEGATTDVAHSRADEGVGDAGVARDHQSSSGRGVERQGARRGGAGERCGEEREEGQEGQGEEGGAGG